MIHCIVGNIADRNNEETDLESLTDTADIIISMIEMAISEPYDPDKM
jgi:hypothetical protein